LFVGGGTDNQATADQSVVGGGRGNWAYEPNSTVGGGIFNHVFGSWGTIAGGIGNVIGYDDGDVLPDNGITISGGQGNRAQGAFSSICGGEGNRVTGVVSTIAGGGSNILHGDFTTIAGGMRNYASGDYCFLAGQDAFDMGYDNCFVWGGAVGDVNANPANARTAAGADTFNVWSSGGIYLNGAVQVSSDRNLKENFGSIDTLAVLAKVVDIPISTWRFKSEDDSITHIGPVAQDFMEIFGYSVDDKHITSTDADGVAFAAIQGLNRKLDKKQTEIDELTLRLDHLEAIIMKLTE
jgi:hypothetical protein